MKFVDNARSWIKKYSTWAFSAITGIVMLEPYLPFLKVIMPGNVFNAVVAVVAVAGIFVTQLKQRNLAPKPPVEEPK